MAYYENEKRGEIELRAKFCSIDIFGGKSSSAEAVRAARAAAVGQERLQQVSSISFVLWPFFVGRRVNVITAKVFEPLGTLFQALRLKLLESLISVHRIY